MKVKLLLLSLLIVALFGSCVTPKDTNLIQDIHKSYKPTATIDQDYHIIAGDQLRLVVYTLDDDMKNLFGMYTKNQNTSSSAVGSLNENTSLTTTYSSSGGNNNSNDQNSDILNVYSDGTVKIPFIGKISVVNMSLLEAKKAIESRFSAFSPSITIEINMMNRYFSILGAVQEKRVAMPSPRINIYQALALGGSIDDFGNRKKVSIIRQTPDGSEVKTFDLRTKDIIDSEYYYIQPNDVIYVQQLSRTFFGRITSFSGLLGSIGLLTTVAALVTAIIKWTK